MLLLAVTEISRAGIVQDLAAVMLMAGLAAALFHCLGWPKVIGYIVAGALIGASPHVSSFLISSNESVSALANLGVIFLMFTLGLELNIKKLRRIGGTIFPTAIFDLLAMLVAGYALGRYFFGFSMLPSLFLGAMVCDSSTTLLAKSLEEMGCSKENFASVIFGTTISQDVMTIGVMAVLTGLSLTGRFHAFELVRNLGMLGLFLVAVMVFGMMLLPRFLDRLSRMKDDETLLVVVLGICFGIAFIAEKLEYSLALGAFLVGAVVAKSSVSRRMYENTGALRNMFSAVFFVTVGLMVKPMEMINNWLSILVLSLLVLAGKTFNCTIMSYLTGQSHKDALKIGTGLAQIGDFSYMVALLGMTLNNGEAPYPRLYQIAVGTSVLTTLLNPFLLRASVPLGEYIESRLSPKILHLMNGYTSWMSSSGKKVRQDSCWSLVRRSFMLYAMDLVLMTAVFFAMHYIGNLSKVRAMLPVDSIRNLSVWLVTCVICFFIMVSAFLHARNLGKLLGGAILPVIANNSLNVSLERLFRLCVILLAIFAMLLMFTYMSAMLMMDGGVVVSMLAFYALLCLVFWKKIKAVVLDGQNTLQMVLEREEYDMSVGKAENGGLLRLPLPAGSGAIGMDLAQLHLRNRTGATIAGIQDAEGRMISNPDAGRRFAEGDVLFLSADREQFVRASELLAQESIEAGGISALTGFLELRAEKVKLDGLAFAVGKSLSELKIRNVSGTTVVRITGRDGCSMENPGPDTVLSGGDEILLLGNAEQIASGMKYLETGKM